MISGTFLRFALIKMPQMTQYVTSDFDWGWEAENHTLDLAKCSCGWHLMVESNHCPLAASGTYLSPQPSSTIPKMSTWNMMGQW
jgi:hypothetical protein